ncbi:MAG: HIT domain-containing protein [Thermomicrobiales bacterium]
MSEEHIERVTDRERLWTPWRMRYIASGGEKEDGCIFCNRLAREDDVDSLILHRGERAFVIMNLYPYNSGHIMILPNTHLDDPTALDTATVHEMAELMPACVRALRRVFACQGFNIGYNVGSAAGAGIAEHLHQHIVPRWNGDANFMPVLASTIAMPELIPASYAKIRAEVERELHGTTDATAIVLANDDRSIVTWNGRLPTVTAEPDQPIWRAAIAPFRGWMDELEIAGWGGATDTRTEPRQTAFVLRGIVREIPVIPDGFAVTDIGTASLPQDDAQMLGRALAHLAPRIAPPPYLT